MLRVSFSTMTMARAAMNELEGYGYSATQFGKEVVTDCPILLAVPAIAKRVGFAEVERLDLNGVTNSVDPTAEFPGPTTARKACASGELTA